MADRRNRRASETRKAIVERTIARVMRLSSIVTLKAATGEEAAATLLREARSLWNQDKITDAEMKTMNDFVKMTKAVRRVDL